MKDELKIKCPKCGSKDAIEEGHSMSLEYRRGKYIDGIYYPPGPPAHVDYYLKCIDCEEPYVIHIKNGIQQEPKSSR